MKKVFYFLPILALLVFTSCEKEEADEIINHNPDTNPFKIKTIENDNGKIFTLAPGLYGPNETAPSTKVTYTLILPPNFSNQAAQGNGTYHLDLYYQEYDSAIDGYTWTKTLSIDRPSNATTLILPAAHDGHKRNKWLIGYGLYNTDIGSWSRYKEIDINH